MSEKSSIKRKLNTEVNECMLIFWTYEDGAKYDGLKGYYNRESRSCNKKSNNFEEKAYSRVNKQSLK